MFLGDELKITFSARETLTQCLVVRDGQNFVKCRCVVLVLVPLHTMSSHEAHFPINLASTMKEGG